MEADLQQQVDEYLELYLCEAILVLQFLEISFSIFD